MRRSLVILSCLCLAFLATFAASQQEAGKDSSGVVMYWPSQDQATIKLTFGKFENMGSTAGQMLLYSNVLVQNLSSNALPAASFTVYLLDKDRVRIGEGTLVVNNLGANQSAKVQFTCGAIGVPSVLSIAAHNSGDAPVSLKTIPMSVVSVPPGANLTVDGKDQGATPAKINLSVGTHQLELKKDGFGVASTPLDIAADEAPGGSITITLPGLSEDSVELRDGSTLSGMVTSMTLDKVVVQSNGQLQTLDRNQVKKIFLVEHVVSTAPAGSVAKKPTQTSSTHQ